MNGLSLFSSGGIAEFGFKKTNINIVVANEILVPRVNAHKYWHPDTEMISGDISNSEIKKEIIKVSKQRGVDFVICTPPCQGVSLIGKNKTLDEFKKDNRNYLLLDAFEVIDEISPNYILVENVTRFSKMHFPFKELILDLENYVNARYEDSYNIDFKVHNTKNYGVPQSRERLIIRMWKKDKNWPINVKEEKEITVREAIGDLPVLESGEASTIKNHKARKHADRHILWMRHTPTGKSAFENKEHYPKNTKTGERLKGYSASYKRIEWDKPAPTITMRNDAISSQSNVHPGEEIKDGIYNNARVLTLRELFILNSVDPDLDIPDNVSESQVRHMIGESVPPKLIYEIVKELK